MGLNDIGISASDFDNNALADFGVTVSRTPQTKVLLESGAEVLSEGTPEDITVVLHVKPTEYTNEKSGDVINVDGYLLISSTTTMNKNDLITFNNKTYIVHAVRPRRPAGDIVIYKYCPIVAYTK